MTIWRRRWNASDADPKNARRGSISGPNFRAPDDAVDFHIRAQVLRSTRLTKLLGLGGRLWRISPIDLTPNQRLRLWDLSQPCKEIDMFLSHTWESAGYQKYVTLLMCFHWRLAAFVGVVAMISLLIMDVAGLLPFIVIQGKQVSLWAPIPPLLALVAMFIAPWLAGDSGPTVFFDATCINQVNPELKEEGIYSLAGFLKHSKELVILWTPDYLSRVWCVYELAMFSSVKDARKIVWRPPFLYWAYFNMYVGWTFVCLGLMLCSTMVPDPLTALLVKVVINVPVTAAVLALVRPYMWCLKQMPQQMADFDVNSAKCRYKSDRKLVVESIEKWYGTTEEFNTYVRGPLRRRAGGPADFHLSYRIVLGIVAPHLCNTAMWIVMQARSGMPLGQLVCFAFGAVAHDVFTLASSSKFALDLWYNFAKPLNTRLAEVALNIALATATCTVSFTVEMLLQVEVVDHSAINHSPRFILLDALAGLAWALVTFRRDFL